MKLSIDEHEALLEALDTPGWAVMLKLLSSLQAEAERAVIKCSSEDEKTLLIRKARAEGAAALVDAFNRSVDAQRAKQKA